MPRSCIRILAWFIATSYRSDASSSSPTSCIHRHSVQIAFLQGPNQSGGHRRLQYQLASRFADAYAKPRKTVSILLRFLLKMRLPTHVNSKKALFGGTSGIRVVDSHGSGIFTIRILLFEHFIAIRTACE